MVSPTTAEVLASVGLSPRGTVSRDTFRRRPRREQRGESIYCSKCGEMRDRENQRYCRNCHNEHARTTRPKHSELSAEARRRANCRRLTNMHIARGKLERQPCACGSTEDLQARQRGDYTDAFDVDFVCKACRTGVRHVAAA